MSQKAQAAGRTGSLQTDLALKPQKKLRVPEKAKRAGQKIEASTPVYIGVDQTEP
jgi:hypothetical protein